MRATIEIRLCPFTIPHTVHLEDPPVPRGVPALGLTQLPITELDEFTISRLCDDFRRRVFAAAGKADPEVE